MQQQGDAAALMMAAPSSWRRRGTGSRRQCSYASLVSDGDEEEDDMNSKGSSRRSLRTRRGPRRKRCTNPVFEVHPRVDRSTTVAAVSCLSPLVATPRRRRSGATTTNMGLLRPLPPPVTAGASPASAATTTTTTTAPATTTATTTPSTTTTAASSIDPWNLHRDELDLFALPQRGRPFAPVTTATPAAARTHRPTRFDTVLDNDHGEVFHGSAARTKNGRSTSATITSFWPSSYDESSDDDYGATTMIYATKYCEQRGHHNSKSNHQKNPLRIQFPKQQRQLKQPPLLPPPLQRSKALNASCSCSFDTLETQTEEETASTFSSSFDDSFKAVRWRDYSLAGALETRHSYTDDDTYTCRIVILLLLNNGISCPPESNFEFLHCEYIVPEKLKVSDVLTQISSLVVAHPSTNNNNNNNGEKHENENYRPFTTLFHQGLEMINALAIQDFDLQDGRSILIAVRAGEQSTATVLKQAAVLLRDKMLLAELRKARIAGRSLQLLRGGGSRNGRGGGGSSIPEKSSTHRRQQQPAIQSNPSLDLASVGSFRDVLTEEFKCG
jgi:hypothetical protein